ncbi:MAG: ATP-binding protein [Parapedobacter sp.]|nr:MAG: ATP-binding protein [Parapedobacter sp.]
MSCSADQTQEEASVANPYYDQAFAYLDAGKADSAFRYFDQARELFLANKDSLRVAACLIQMAITLTNQNDYFGAQETSLQANDYLDTENPKHHIYLSSNFNNLGRSTYLLKDFDRAISFYDSAIQFSDDSLNTRIFLNNKAKAYHDNKQYAEALKIYEHIIQENSKNPREYARALTNISDTRWHQNPAYNAAPHLLTALHIREQENDKWGQNSSYAHLAAYYEQKRPDSALIFARKRYAIAGEIKSADDQIMGLQMLIKLSSPDSTKWYFDVYRRLSDSVQLARAAAKNQFALIRYEVEKNKAENLKLQQENAVRNLQINRQRTITAMVSLFAIALIGGGMYWYRKRKQRLELEAQNRIKASQLRTSKKVHDVVANGLYRVMAEIENKSDIDREGILDRLEDMYEKSRDISYEAEDPPIQQIDYHQKVTDLLTSFATDSTKVLIAGNDSDVWADVSVEARYEIEHILQELMVNMKKHSRASHVAMRFERHNHQFSIHYSDNGIGLPPNFQKGNGLINTGNRIKNLQGDFTFDTGENGLKIRMTFPLS